MPGAVSHSPKTFQRLKVHIRVKVPKYFLYGESIKDLTCLPVAASTFLDLGIIYHYGIDHTYRQGNMFIKFTLNF